MTIISVGPVYPLNFILVLYTRSIPQFNILNKLTLDSKDSETSVIVSALATKRATRNSSRFRR